MSDEEPPVPEEVLTSAKDQLDDEEISLADNEEILHALSELTLVVVREQPWDSFVLIYRRPKRNHRPVAKPDLISRSPFSISYN